MHAWRVAAAALAAGACLSACATAPAYPTTTPPQPEIDRAARLVAEAQAAGADSLASAALATARKTLDDARQQQERQRDRATITARRAAIEAAYARALAERELAQRARNEATKAIEGVPPGGAR